MARRKASPRKPRPAHKPIDLRKVKEVLRDAELKKFDPELREIVDRSRRK